MRAKEVSMGGRDFLKVLVVGSVVVAVCAVVASLYINIADKSIEIKLLTENLKDTDSISEHRLRTIDDLRLEKEKLMIENAILRKREPTVEFVQGFIMGRQSMLSSAVAKEIAHNVVKYSKMREIPASLIVGMIEAESVYYNPMAISHMGAVGLMQVMFKYHSDKVEKERDLFEIDKNIEVGTLILKDLLEKHGLEKAIAKYRGGSNGEYLRKITTVAAMFEVQLLKRSNKNAGSE
jgi:hypothetical protein